MKKDANFKSFVKDMLAMVKISSDMIRIPEYDATDLRLVFCVTCLKREEQLVTAMVLNVSLWWSLRKYWRLVIVTFADDKDLQCELQRLMTLPIETGNVVLCSGGECGKQLAADRMATDRPDFMPRLWTDVSAGGIVCSPVQMPFMNYWHASIAKNSSHQAGIYCFPGTGSLLINLDCDQVVPIAYVRAALQTFHHNLKLTGFCLCCDERGPLTGRLGYRQEDFIFLGGYDEDGPPSAGQDVDFRRRLFQHGADHGCNPKKVEWLKTTEVCGFALPNDFKDTTRLHDRGKSKVVNCDPDFLQKFSCDLTQVWEKMRVDSWTSYWKPLLDKKITIRNLTARSKKAGLGAWWVVIRRNVVSHTDTQDFDEAHGRPAAGSADVDMVNVAPIVPRVSSGPAQSVVGRDVGISVEIFIVGASEVQFKTRTMISSLGRSNDYDVVVFPNLSQASSSFLIHGSCVFIFFDSRRACVHVYTWRCRKTLGDAVQDNVSDVDNLLIKALVEGKLMLLPTEKTLILCFDCRAMGEPQDTADRHHFGTFPSLLTGYATDPKLQEHVQQLRREIEICKNSGVASIKLIVFDKRGRWAAMAVGKAFAEIAVNTQSLTLRSVSFLMHYHDRDCKGCEYCAFWTRKWKGCLVFSARMVALYEATVLA